MDAPPATTTHPTTGPGSVARVTDTGRGPRRDVGGAAVLALGLVALVLAKPALAAAVLDRPGLAAWLTVFVSVSLQALPFLVMGVGLSAALAVFVPAATLARLVPANPAVAVPVAGLSGAVLPGCECASVPIAGSLVRRGVTPAIALTFLLAAPAINPVVLVSTAVAFGGRYEVVAARFAASLATAVVVGWIWIRLGRGIPLRMPPRPHAHAGRLATAADAIRHDALHAGGFLVVGGAVAATVNVLVPPAWLDSLAGNLLVAVVVLAVFAVVVAVCSEADAFVAASLTAFPLTARLVFMVVGPVMDVKLFAMQVGTFGGAFALRFAPLVLTVAVTMGTVVGLVLL